MNLSKTGKLEWEGSVEIDGVTPEMMMWYSLNRNTERYKLWHPGHIEFKTLYKPPQGYAGTVYLIKEKVGKYVVKMRLTVTEVTDNTFAGIFRTQGYNWFFHLRFESTPRGMVLHSSHSLGSDNPLWGPAWNWFIRNFLYTRGLRAAHAIHGREEKENLQKFLPRLYRECSGLS
jgi:hypothetical protein